VSRGRPGPTVRHGVSGRRGYTLVELVVVMVLASIMAAATAPALWSVGQARRAAAAAHVLRDVTFARQWALATGMRTWVSFDVAAGSYRVLVEDGENPGRANASLVAEPGTGRPIERSLGTGILAGAGLVSAAFDGGAEVGFDWLARPLNVGELPLSADGAVDLAGGWRVVVMAGTGLAESRRP
jgi:prepilin-type N-terminal cleavage/methylation domain-containing protein